MAEKYEGYCVKCREKREFDGEWTAFQAGFQSERDALELIVDDGSGNRLTQFGQASEGFQGFVVGEKPLPLCRMTGDAQGIARRGGIRRKDERDERAAFQGGGVEFDSR